MNMANKVAVVTGADSGIGQATAVALAQQGADIVVGYHSDAGGGAETTRRVQLAGPAAGGCPDTMRTGYHASADWRFVPADLRVSRPADTTMSVAGADGP